MWKYIIFIKYIELYRIVAHVRWHPDFLCRGYSPCVRYAPYWFFHQPISTDVCRWKGEYIYEYEQFCNTNRQQHRSCSFQLIRTCGGDAGRSYVLVDDLIEYLFSDDQIDQISESKEKKKLGRPRKSWRKIPCTGKSSISCGPLSDGPILSMRYGPS